MATRKHIVYSLVFGFLGFLAFEAAIFRSGLYREIVEPNSFSGRLWFAAKSEKSRPPSGKREVLVIGNSRIGEGFSARIADEIGDAYGLKFINAGIPGSGLRTWNYFLREIDPSADRYAAIVIQFNSYADEDEPERFSQQNRGLLLDLKMISPVTRAVDFPDLYSEISDPFHNMDLLLSLCFKGLVYRQDFANLLLSPRERFQDLHAVKSRPPGFEFGYAYRGQEKTVSLSDRPKTTMVHWPNLGTAESHTKKWLGKIVERYSKSQTKLIAVRIPVTPFGEPNDSVTIASNTVTILGGLSAFQKAGQVVVVPESTFVDLETPENFFDDKHLNRTGRESFSARLVSEINRIVGKQANNDAI